MLYSLLKRHKKRKKGPLMALHVVLHEPDIPGNTGNVARTCVGTNSTLHLIHPLGFSIEDKMLKRAGLDYWKHLSLREYDSIEHFFAENKKGRFFFVEDYGGNTYSDFDFSSIEEDIYFIFGSETKGLPLSLLEGKEDQCLRLPMSGNVRSLNLSNTVAVVVFEALRQKGFPNLS